MDCTAAKSLLNAYLDGELSGSLAAEFAAHKLQCPACRRELALLEVTGHVLAADTDVPQLDEDFTDRLIACAAAPAPLHRRHRRLLLVIGAPLAAAASLLLVVSLYMMSPKPADEGKPRETLVLDHIERMDSAQEMLEQIEQARRVHPDNAELAELERALRERVDQIANGSEQGADLLENYGKLTIMELLESMKLDRPKQNDATPPDANTSGDEHDPRVEDL
jgi:hypothetical protein